MAITAQTVLGKLIEGSWCDFQRVGPPSSMKSHQEVKIEEATKKKKNLKSKSRLMAEIASGNNYALCIHYFDVYNEFISHSNVNHCPWKGRGVSERWTTMQYTLLPTINMLISFGQAEDKWILLGHATNACRARLGNMVTPHCTSRDWNPNQPSKEKAEVLTMIYCGSGWVC